MILSIIFHILKRAIGVVIKVIAWLLVALSLWVPLLYTLIFVIVCGLTENSLTQYSSWYFGGLAVSFVGSFIVSTFIYELGLVKKKKQKQVSLDNLQKVKEKQEPTEKQQAVACQAVVEQSQEANYSASENQIGYQQSPPASVGGIAAKHDFIGYGPNETQPISPPSQTGYNFGQAGYHDYGYNSPQSNYGLEQSNQNNFAALDNISFDPYPSMNKDSLPPASQSAEGFGEFPQVYQPEQTENPRVFATRSDPDVLIYEFSTRIEFYKKTHNGLVLIRTQNR